MRLTGLFTHINKRSLRICSLYSPSSLLFLLIVNKPLNVKPILNHYCFINKSFKFWLIENDTIANPSQGSESWVYHMRQFPLTTLDSKHSSRLRTLPLDNFYSTSNLLSRLSTLKIHLMLSVKRSCLSGFVITNELALPSPHVTILHRLC